MSQDIATATAQITAFSNELASLLRFSGWEIQDGSYNGVYFHVMQPNYNLLNPAQGITNYLVDPTSTATLPVGAKTGVTPINDKVTRKLTEYIIPNREGNVLEDYGVHSPVITIVGLVTGKANAMSVFQSQLTFFLDSPQDTSVIQSEQLGTLSGSNFRVLIHPLFGIIPQVMLLDYEILIASERHNSMAFKLIFKVPDPSYLKQFSIPSDWQSSVQTSLNLAEVAAIEIVQTFSLLEGLTTHSYPYNNELSLSTNGTLPILDSTGIYLSSVTAQITASLAALAAVFTNSIAYLVQFSGSSVFNSFYDSIVINFSILPVYTPNNQVFQFSDAQSLLTHYTTQMNAFFAFVEKFNYDYFLQLNIEALRDSVVYMNSISQGILLKNNSLKELKLNTNQSLFSFALQNGVGVDDLDEVAQRNAGRYFDALLVPAGTTLELVL